MQILTIDKDKFVAVDGDRATVYSKSQLEEQKKVAEYNIEQINLSLVDLKTQVAQEGALSGLELEAVKQYNQRLGIERLKHELDEWKTKLVELNTILNT